MPKVLRIINRLNLGGPTFNACYLTKYLSDDYETMLVAGMKDDSEASSAFIAESMGIEPVYIEHMYRSINPIKDYPAFKHIRQIIRDFKPDIVHTHAAKSGALGRHAAIAENVPIILHTFHGHVFHSYFHPLKTKVFLEIERYLAKRSTKIIAISELQKKELSEEFKVAPPEKFEVIPLGFDLGRFQVNQEEKRSAFRKSYGLQEDDIAVGIIGRLVPIKNHELYLNSIAKIKKRGAKKVRGIIIGDGELRKDLEKRCENLGLTFDTDRIKENTDILFTSWIKEIDTALPGLDVVCLTSHNEGTPVSLIEAQAASKPIVSTRVGGIGDVVKEGVTGLLSDRNNDEQFIENLLNVVSNSALRQQLSSVSAEHVQERFSHLRLARDMEALYDKLLS